VAGDDCGAIVTARPAQTVKPMLATRKVRVRAICIGFPAAKRLSLVGQNHKQIRDASRGLRGDLLEGPKAA